MDIEAYFLSLDISLCSRVSIRGRLGKEWLREKVPQVGRHQTVLKQGWATHHTIHSVFHRALGVWTLSSKQWGVTRKQRCGQHTLERLP